MRLSIYMIIFSLSITIFSAGVGYIFKVEGDSFLKKHYLKKYIKATSNLEISEGDYLRTSQNGKIEIVFFDKTRVIIGSNSKLLIDKYLLKRTKRDAKFKILLGKFNFFVSKFKNSKNNSFNVEMKTVVIGVRGTEFILDNEKGEVAVLSGKVKLSNGKFVDEGFYWDGDKTLTKLNIKKIKKLKEQFIFKQFMAYADSIPKNRSDSSSRGGGLGVVDKKNELDKEETGFAENMKENRNIKIKSDKSVNSKSIKKKGSKCDFGNKKLVKRYKNISIVPPGKLIHPKIYFNKDKIDKKSYKTLTNIVQFLRINKKHIKQIVIVLYLNDTFKKEEREKLSNLRAKEIKKFLSKKGAKFRYILYPKSILNPIIKIDKFLNCLNSPKCSSSDKKSAQKIVKMGREQNERVIIRVKLK